MLAKVTGETVAWLVMVISWTMRCGQSRNASAAAGVVDDNNDTRDKIRRRRETPTTRC